MTCPVCGGVVFEGARFCPSCGHQLVSRSDERRIATVLFADLVGFTALAETRDPEQVKELVDSCFERLVGDITSFGGRVDKIIGDAILALFGAPVAHEDDAERAVRAALRMQQTLNRYADEAGATVQMRVGVNTGEVLVGALRAGGDYTAMGDVVNTAQRLQTSAEPGTVVVGPATHAATADAIEYTPLGLVDARGRGEPVEAWVAVEPLLPPGYRRRRLQTPFVGREAEFDLLDSAVRAAADRQRAHLIVVLGEAGVGKSRLAEEVAKAASDRGAVVFEGRCVPYGEANVWWPVAEALRQACGVSTDDPLPSADRACRAAVAGALGQEERSPEVKRIVNGLLYLMGYEVSLRDIDPQRARDEAQRSVLAFIEASSRQQPVVVVLSDLHWADDLVLSMVDELLDRMSRSRVVTIATARPSLLDRWILPAGRHNTLVANLDPLERGAAAELLDALIEGRDEATREALLDRSGGNPFFLEELVAFVGPGDAEVADTVPAGRAGELPDTLRGLVAARIDALGPAERAVLEDAAVWGRSGPVQALERMAAEMHDLRDVDPVVARLVDHEVLVVTADRWRFRNDLMREVAYNTLTKADRARRHTGIAAYLEHTNGGRDTVSDRLVDIIAYHFAVAADLVAEVGGVDDIPVSLDAHAVLWLTEAAHRAQVAQAMPVAARLFGQALRLADPTDAALRVDLLLGRANAEAEMRQLGPARTDVEEAMALAADLDVATGARCLLVLGDLEQKTGELDAALATLATAGHQFAELGDLKGVADAQRLTGLTQLFAGRLDDAEASIQRALAANREVGDRRGEAWALQNLAWISYVKGRAGEAEQRITDSANTFAELADSGGLNWALGLLGFVKYHQGHLREAGELAEQVLVEARERGDRWGEGMMLLLMSGVRQWSGRTQAALVAADDALATFTAIGDKFGEVQALAARGRAKVSVGQVADGLALLQESMMTSGGAGQADFAAVAAGALASAGVQIGAPYLTFEVLDPMLGPDDVFDPGETIGSRDVLVARGLASLQVDDVVGALAALEAAAEPDEEGTPSSYGLAALALAKAAAGAVGEAVELAEQVTAARRTTYSDLATATIAALLARAAVGDTAVVAEFEELQAVVDATDDRVARAVVALARAAALRALDDEGAAAVQRRADALLAALDLHAEGWRTVFARALSPSPAATGGRT